MTEKQILKKQKESADASPAKSLLSDLAELRTLLRATGRAYLQRLEGDIDELAVWARMRASEKKMPKAGIRNLGDMVTLVRKLDVKPIKGRRKDLKKIDATIGDLRELVAKS